MQAGVLPPSLVRALGDKLYEKRKAAALEVEGHVKQLVAAGESDKIRAVLELLITDFALSPRLNSRKGGLIGLAAASVGLASKCPTYLQMIVPPVLKSFSDQDGRVRYYACEALYNIAKVARGEFIIFFNPVFEALCKLSADADTQVQNAAHLLDRLIKDIVTACEAFDIESFVPILKERMNVLNPFVRQFIVGWITVLDSVPDIDMLEHLPELLDGLMNMLSDSNREIRHLADQALNEFLGEIKAAPKFVDFGTMAPTLVAKAGSSDEFTRLTALTWIHNFVTLAGAKLMPYYPAIIGSILPCTSHSVERVKEMAHETNDKLLALCSAGTITEVNLGEVLDIVGQELKNEQEGARLEALRWITVLLEKQRDQMSVYFMELFTVLLDLFSDASNQVVLQVVDVLARIAEHHEGPHFSDLVLALLARFNARDEAGARVLLERCGDRGLGWGRKGAGAGDCSRAMPKGALNAILLTASELAGVRSLLKDSQQVAAGADLFNALYPSWCHSPVSTVSLCLLAQAYPLAHGLIVRVGNADVSIDVLLQLDRLVCLLESSIFTHLRLKLLDPMRFPYLMRAMYGILMLLPQSSAFKLLRTRLKSVPSLALANLSVDSSYPSGAAEGTVTGVVAGFNVSPSGEARPSPVGCAPSAPEGTSEPPSLRLQPGMGEEWASHGPRPVGADASMQESIVAAPLGSMAAAPAMATADTARSSQDGARGAPVGDLMSQPRARGGSAAADVDALLMKFDALQQRHARQEQPGVGAVPVPTGAVP
eukprot:jgi/Mesvir1/1223/Mv17708-RA.1